MADRFPLILNTSNNQIQEIASGDNLDMTGNNIKSVTTSDQRKSWYCPKIQK